MNEREREMGWFIKKCLVSKGKEKYERENVGECGWGRQRNKIKKHKNKSDTIRKKERKKERKIRTRSVRKK